MRNVTMETCVNNLTKIHDISHEALLSSAAGVLARLAGHGQRGRLPHAGRRNQVHLPGITRPGPVVMTCFAGGEFGVILGTVAAYIVLFLESFRRFAP